MAFNKVILMGNLTADPEVKVTQSGISVCSFSIAVNRKGAKNGEVDFIRCQAWRQQAEFIGKYFKKGKPILVCGQLQTRTWTDTQGNKREAADVVADEISFVGSAESSTETKNEPVTMPHMPSAYGGVNNPGFEPIPANAGDEGLPF